MTPSEQSASPLAEGERVVITDHNHPHYPKGGILRTTATFLFPWRVVFDDGTSACVDEREVRRVEKQGG